MQDKEDLRERVLRASVELIEEEGLGALSMREVARRAGVSHQAPYHYFPDRMAILAAVAERGFQMIEDKLREARAQAQGATHAIELAGIAYVDFACEHPAHFRIMFRPELVDLHLHHEADCTATKAFCHVPELVMGLFQAGLPEDIGIEPMSALLWSTVHGFACLLLDGSLGEKLPSMKDPRQAARDLARSMRRMLDTAIGKAAAAAKPSLSGRADAKAKRSTGRGGRKK
jgi:AcrR family transcriptional regulator